MEAIHDYIKNYSAADLDKIKFTWNGKHSEEFEDQNQDFRQSVVALCLDTPSSAPSCLLQQLFIEEAKWANEAWGSPRNFGQLGQLLLELGDKEAAKAFAIGMNSSFDTFGACHEINLGPADHKTATSIIDQLLKIESDEVLCSKLKEVEQLLIKMARGSAQEGWVKVEPGTPVTNIQVRKSTLFRRFIDWLTKD